MGQTGNNPRATGSQKLVHLNAILLCFLNRFFSSSPASFMQVVNINVGCALNYRDSLLGRD